MFKIQDILATKQSLMLLSKETKKDENKENILQEKNNSLEKSESMIFQNDSLHKKDLKENSEDEEEYERKCLGKKRVESKVNKVLKENFSYL